MSTDTVSSNADAIDRSDASGNLDDLRNSVYTGASDDQGGEPPTTEPSGEPVIDTPSDDPLARELTDEEREGYPEHVRTVSDVMKYARELNRYKGTAGNEIGELRKQISDLSNRFAQPTAPAAKEQTSLTPQEYQAMIERGLATDPVNTIQEMLKLGIERALKERLEPVQKNVETVQQTFQERERQAALDSFVAKNNLSDADMKEVMDTMARRMEIYQGSPYFEGQPRRVLEDVWEIMQAKRSAQVGAVETKRAKVISKGSGGIPRTDAKEGEPSREDVERAMGLR